MTEPPATLIAWPVMYSAPSPTRNAMTSATSDGRAMRPSGTAAEVVEALGVGGARTHGVDGNAGRSQLLGERLREADDTELRRAVGGASGPADLAPLRGDVHDAPAHAALQHRPGHGPRAEERAFQVDPEHEVPGFFR